MTCPHCPPRVEEALRKVEGVSGVHVNLANRVAHVTYDASRAKVVDLITPIRTAGYTAGDRQDAHPHRQHALQLVRDPHRARAAA